MIASYKKQAVLFAVLLAVSLATRFAFISQPREVVFDEVHYGNYAVGYLTGEHFFSGHPPLGAELIALTAKLFGFGGSDSFRNIGGKFANPLPLRFAPALAGSMIPPVAFILAVVLGASLTAAFTAGALLIFDNALLAQSRFVLIDSFLILFGLLGLVFFLKARQNGYRHSFLAASGFFLALSMAVKWSAAGFMLFVFAAVGWDAVSIFLKKNVASGIRLLAKNAVWLFAAPVFIYGLVWVVHVVLMTNPGSGDAYVSKNFRERGVLNRIVELNKASYYSNFANFTASHPYSSKFYAWPLLSRPVFFWIKSYADGRYARIYSVGNPFLWWGSSAGILLAFFFWRPRRKETKWILYGAYAALMLPFAFVGRIVFLYHYLPAFVFAALISVLWFFEFLEGRERKKVYSAAAALTGAAFLVFTLYAPLSYGFPLAESQYEARLLLESWR